MSAKFPTQAPTVYSDKSTANDVGDTAHWDGSDANAVKAEVVAVAAKVGINGDANPASHDYKIAALESRKAVSTGSSTLVASTSTTVTDSAAGANSTIVVQARSSAFGALSPRPYVSAKGSGSFTLTHGSAAGTETFDYIVVN
jgi:hypothetical protein